ncbi:hypothetical protein CHH28_11655 [Bacterioplanes sanyensis]|uniref:DUF3087 domain-containing protein n=1 Tax=Bacterioplanes sanyensis TaxID=1249553 RepID=A0A222FKV8_9GAMM|nr:DUF3087 family protein [Bacterioplanes sanyensis]ASP39292.1 hypothetical protein CHH28_11655 [Bacterioplanes sanyensis]
MGFKAIDKASYQQRVSRLQWALIAALLLIGLSLSELYHQLWGHDSGLWLNFAAVVSALALVSIALYLLRDRPWMEDIRYVLRLKSELNRIYRSSRALEEALQRDDETAIRIRYYSLHGSYYLYQLENNTLTLEELSEQIQQLDEQIACLGLQVSVDDYHAGLLKAL